MPFSVGLFSICHSAWFKMDAQYSACKSVSSGRFWRHSSCRCACDIPPVTTGGGISRRDCCNSIAGSAHGGAAVCGSVSHVHWSHPSTDSSLQPAEAAGAAANTIIISSFVLCDIPATSISPEDEDALICRCCNTYRTIMLPFKGLQAPAITDWLRRGPWQRPSCTMGALDSFCRAPL
jgi:hypothetical protein